ncbi:hypothetical protein Lal_00044308, partial [Lupinus albus]
VVSELALLENQIMEDEDSQRNNIFHSRCLVYGKVCLLMIDSGSHANIVSSRVVKKLNLITIPHPSPYRLQRSNEDGEVIVNKQVGIPFSIGKYEDLVLCDVAHNGACHIILGRPWQYDKRTLHDCFSNKITFLHLNRKVVLSSLSPKQVKEDQRRLREKLEEERKETLCENKSVKLKARDFAWILIFMRKLLCIMMFVWMCRNFLRRPQKNLTSMEPQDIEKDASNLITQSSVMRLDTKFHYFVISMTPFVISNLEPNMLHNIVSPHASSHRFTSNMFYVLLVSSNIASERSNKNGVTKDGFERRVFDPGGGCYQVVSELALLENQIMEDEDSQRNNIFHSRCLVYGKVCLLMIDSGSHANIVSSRVVKKLNLITIPHPSPYRLQRSNEDGEVIVNKQVGIPFSIGKYEDLVLCDVAHNGACHIILGRPWQYDKRTLHDCFSNKITFLHLNRKVVLSSLSPKQVKEDQRRLREKLEEERKETLCEKQECEIKSKGLCLDSNFHEETLVHNDVCLDVQELPKEASKKFNIHGTPRY